MNSKKVLMTVLVGVLSLGAIGLSIFSTNVAASNPLDVIDQYKNIEKTPQGVQKYQDYINKKSQELKEDKVEEIIATITFAKPLSYQKLETYIAKHNITPKQIQIRGLVGDKRITIAVKPSANMQQVVANQLKYPEPAKFVGYIDIYAVVDYTAIDRIQNDTNTFLIDTSADSHFTGSDDEFPHALSWLLEDIE
jgi:hypothetical protein